MLVCEVCGCGHAQVAAPVCVCACACVHVGPQTCIASRRLVVMVEEQEARYSSRWPTADVTREDAKAPASKAEGAAMVLSCTLS